MFDYKKELEEFDQMLSSMTGDEVMEMLVENGYGKIKSPSDYGCVISNEGIYSVANKINLKTPDLKFSGYNKKNGIYLGAA